MRAPRLGRLSIAASLGHAAWTTRRQWQALPPERRSRLKGLLHQSAGSPASLSEADRRELRNLIGELNLGEVMRDTANRATRGRRRW